MAAAGDALSLLYRLVPRSCSRLWSTALLLPPPPLPHMQLQQRAGYSRYLPKERYVEPIIQKSELLERVAADDERQFRIVKPATINQFSSPAYDETVEKFINMIMREGKKSVARHVMRKTLEKIKLVQVEKYNRASAEEREKIDVNPVHVLHSAYENCKPTVRLVRTVRAGVAYQVPIACDESHRRFMSMKWLIQSAKDKMDNVRIEDALARELLDASKNEGKSIRKKHELHKQCEANRAYAHFRWQ